jgi:hypothetical protein
MNKLQHLQYLNFRKPSRYADNITAIQAKPSLDLNFARNKSLMDNVTGNNLITFTRASSGTFIDSTGTIRTATTNLLLRSEEFDNASWTGSESNTTVTANTSTAPNGTVTADTIDFTNASSFRYQLVLGTPAGTTYTFSVWLASGTKTQTVIRIAGTATGSGGQLVVNLTPTLTRYSVTVTIPSGNTAAFVGFENRVAVGGGNGSTGTIIAWGAQLEQSATVGEYIPTTTTINSAPRFDHNPTTRESLGLLVEEQRTNSITNNTMVGAVAGTPGTLPTGWAYFAATTGLTASIVGTGTESGISYIDLRLNGTAGSASPSELALNTAAAATGQVWTWGTYWRLAAGSTSGISSFELGQVELTSGGAFVSGAFVAQTAPTTSGWISQRPAYTRTLSGGATVGLVAPRVRITPVNGAAIDFTLRIGMPQLEQGTFATSVIPTSGTAATRAADVASISGSNFSSWYRQDEGTVFGLYSHIGAVGANNGLFNMHDSSLPNNNRHTIRAGTYAVTTGGVIQATGSYSIPGVNVLGKIAYTYKADDIVLVRPVDQVLLTDNSATLPSGINIFEIGKIEGTALQINGHIRRLTYFPQRLSNANLQRITQ